MRKFTRLNISREFWGKPMWAAGKFQDSTMRKRPKLRSDRSFISLKASGINDFMLEDRKVPAIFSFSSGILSINADNDNELFSISADSNNGNYTITSIFNFSGSDRPGELNGNATNMLKVSNNLNLSEIQISDSNGNFSGTELHFGISSGNFVDNLNVKFANLSSGDIYGDRLAYFSNGAGISLTSNHSAIKIISPIRVTGSGAIRFQSRNIELNQDISTGSGDIELLGDLGYQQSGDFPGVIIYRNLYSSGGSISITGRGGDSGAMGQYGVAITSGANITTYGNGSITINGTGGNLSSSDPAQGVYFAGLNTNIRTVNGDITITGTGGTGSARDSSGIDFTGRAALTTTGAGNIRIYGYGGSGSWWPAGVMIESTNVNIQATGSGNINISGTGGNNSNVATHGVYITQASINVSNGTLSVNATYGTNALTPNIEIDSSANLFASQINLRSNSLSIGSTASINTGLNGNVCIPADLVSVKIGGNDDSGNLGITQAELNRITTGCLKIVSKSTAGILFNSSVAWGANLTLISAGSITQSTGANLTLKGLGNFVSTDINNTGDISFDQLGNNFDRNSPLSATGHNITLYNSNSTLLANISAVNLFVNATSGSILQSNLSSLSISEKATLVALSDVVLSKNNNLLNNLSLNGSNAIISTVNNICFTKVGVTGNLTIQQANSISIDSSNFSVPNLNIKSGVLSLNSILNTNIVISNSNLIAGTNSNITGNVSIDCGVIFANGSISNLILNNAILNTIGNGIVVKNLISFNSNSSWIACGTSYSDFSMIRANQINIANDTQLYVYLPGVIDYSKKLTLIQNNSNLPLIGNFIGLANGSLLNTSGSFSTSLKINYKAGTNLNNLQLTVATGRINVLTPNITTKSNSQFSTGFQFRIIGGASNSTGIANVPFTISLPSPVLNCNIASASFDPVNQNNTTISVVSDSTGNVTLPIWAGINPGPFQAKIIQSDDPSVYSNPYLGVIGLSVQRQSLNRSFVRYLDLVLDSNDLSNVTTVNQFLSNLKLSKVESAGYSGGSNITDNTNYFNNAACIYTNPVGYTIDFGIYGLGNNSSSPNSDGVYLISNINVNTSNSISYTFHRLLGDINGDGVVDARDTDLIQTVLNSNAWRYQSGFNCTFDDLNPSNTTIMPVAYSAWVGDTNGDGKINALDLNITGFNRGRRVAYRHGRRIT